MARKRYVKRHAKRNESPSPLVAGPYEMPICALCERRIPPHARQSVHHLIPKLKGGSGGPTVLLHQICHNEIHANLTEAELARLQHPISASE